MGSKEHHDQVSLPVGGYSVQSYVGCTHACKYCYASFMKRFTRHTRRGMGTFLDVKHWPVIKNRKEICRTAGGHQFCDGWLQSTGGAIRECRKTSGRLIGSDANILICTKSDLVVRDIDLLKLGRVTVSWSINTLDENFKNDMDSLSKALKRRILCYKTEYMMQGIRTVCFVSPVFPVSRTLKQSLSG